ncbi:hypothetical protein [Streptomyces sp. SID5910]|uniref:hypothetical protein n=1 Tax=Streptomyces sp. SID5910 TaxID=2690312 RepID=UPI00136EA389|nr:hypothetical protein [Streptomyces sp. SID5910]MYR43092.1 hypothetical protein [Streptomyces sp. SID5910]
MMYTLADAIRDEFRRTHPGNRGVLKCTSCYRRKDREEFRETPWHGRAAACKRCEGVTWLILQYEQQRWALAQEREKTRMLRRHVQRLRFAHYRPRYVMGWPSSARPLLTEPIPGTARHRKRARLTKENR